jgi:hypothetical protein
MPEINVMALGKSSILTLIIRIATKYTTPQYVHCEVQF